jgi:hypothetical protein
MCFYMFRLFYAMNFQLIKIRRLFSTNPNYVPQIKTRVPQIIMRIPQTQTRIPQITSAFWLFAIVFLLQDFLDNISINKN